MRVNGGGGQVSVAQGTIQLAVLVLFLLAVGWPNRSNFHVYASKESEIVASWAQKFGEELWDLGEKMTKSQEIRQKYKSNNARVEHKGNETLIMSIVENVGRMLQRKIDAVRCILNVAEQSAEDFESDPSDNGTNFTYYSSKYSPIDGRSLLETAMYKDECIDDKEECLPDVVLNASDIYRPMFLDQDTHFYNIDVNTTHSSVHVPTNVFDRSPEVLEALRWSEALDDVFRQNYQSDPALSWQYFGSDTGIMRHFPAKMWESKKKVDMYDCRKRSWYIETATCSKDIVILLDNSGSMTGFRNYIAQLTVKSILDTLSNNDFINIYNYSDTHRPIVKCFNETLVQATPENIEVFNTAVRGLKPNGTSDERSILSSFSTAFELLEKYRVQRRCNESSTGCNQAIMLITDGIPGNLTEVFDRYNRLENGTRTPVRVFTYLLGKEVTNVREIQWMACLNRGYYSHVQTLDQVQGEVLKYVTVIATPLVLQGVEHPPTWTHAFRDEAHPSDPNVRLMIAVGVPAFDRKRAKMGNGEPGSAQLLGVASTDVPVEDINKLTLPYKLGVNGYSFVVSNNGYVLLHPDLRPTEGDQLKINYNSIDLTEVEQFNDGVDGRRPGERLLSLRESLVNNENGKLLNVSVKFHFDEMRRVSVENYDYYFAPLPNTPFSMGLAIPSGYGNTWIKVGDEVRRNNHMGINMSDFFVGENWKVHPEWVYCHYHYLEGHEFKTPEDELRHFLTKLADKSWKWAQQYEPEEPKDERERSNNTNNEPNCGRKTFDTDAYYCNKELVQLLIFDAKVTNTSYRTWKFDSDEERRLIELYNATLRFVATMSGLTRWQFIYGEVEVDTDKEFGDSYKMAVDETWYKMAILQHQIDPKSFVFTVDAMNSNSDYMVTASHAIFPRDGGIEAPGSVVGFQFSHERMRERFLEITDNVNCDGCLKPCRHELQDCYVLDSNGYVLLSEHENDTDAYFGELESTGAIMQSMIDLGIFQQLSIYDFQAHCVEEVVKLNDAETMITPFRLVVLAIKWVFYEMFMFLNRMDLWVQGMPSYYDEEPDYNGDAAATHTPRSLRKGINEDEETYFKRPIIVEYEKVYHACDKQINLTVLQQKLFIDGHSLPAQVRPNCTPPYFFQRIPHTNLLLVVVDAAYSYSTCKVRVSAQPEQMLYPENFPCYKLSLNDLHRRRLDECFTEHPEEANVTQCGLATSIKLTMAAVFWSGVYTLTLHYAH